MSEVIISEAAIAAPKRRARMRKGRSVMPAIGASTAGALMLQRPIWKAADTTALSTTLTDETGPTLERSPAAQRHERRVGTNDFIGLFVE